jgi:hypothetical protein
MEFKNKELVPIAIDSNETDALCKSEQPSVVFTPFLRIC